MISNDFGWKNRLSSKETRVNVLDLCLWGWIPHRNWKEFGNVLFLSQFTHRVGLTFMFFRHGWVWKRTKRYLVVVHKIETGGGLIERSIFLCIVRAGCTHTVVALTSESAIRCLVFVRNTCTPRAINCRWSWLLGEPSPMTAISLCVVKIILMCMSQNWPNERRTLFDPRNRRTSRARQGNIVLWSRTMCAESMIVLCGKVAL